MYSYCNNCKKSLHIERFDKKNETEYYTRCIKCKDIHNIREKNRYIKILNTFDTYDGLTINNKLKVDCWHPTKNGKLKPCDVTKGSSKKYWFICDNCPHEFNASLNKISAGRWCPYCSIPCKKLCDNKNCTFCYEKSFASYIGKTTNDKLKVDCWHPTKNGILTSHNITKNSHKKCWFICDNCPHDVNSIISGITYRKRWCPYCSNQTKCNDNNCNYCFNNSFASYTGKTKNDKLKVDCWHPTKNGKLKPYDVSKCSKKIYWFICDNCPHEFTSRLYNISYGKWCPYCNNNKLCNDKNCNCCFNKSFASYTGKTKNDKLKIDCWHPTKNQKLTPHNISKGAEKFIWFICDNCYCEFNSMLYSITGKNETWCPNCNESKGEKKITELLNKLNYKDNKQKTFPTCKDKSKLKFDNGIINELSMDILIEFDGIQHFEYVNYFHKNKKKYKTQIRRDIIKNKWCLENNKILLRIAHTDIDNIEYWINEAIKKSKNNESCIIYSNPTLYKTTYLPSWKTFINIRTLQRMYRNKKF